MSLLGSLRFIFQISLSHGSFTGLWDFKKMKSYFAASAEAKSTIRIILWYTMFTQYCGRSLVTPMTPEKHRRKQQQQRKKQETPWRGTEENNCYPNPTVLGKRKLPF